MAEQTVNLLQRGRAACEQDRYRRGNVIFLPAEGTLVATGDIHGHRRNFERIVSFADLKNNRRNHVLLHELIHGGREDDFGGCLSYELLFDAIKYKLEFPDQVHFIMGNHDTTFINNSRVMKNGKEMNLAFRQGLDNRFGRDSEKVKLAMRQFLFSQALAVKCPNRIWLSHSLPSDREAEQFDFGIFDRHLKINDVVKPGAAYLLTWGRRIGQASLDKFARMLEVDIFIVGHQPQERGFFRAANNLIIIASDHDHGCLLPINLARFYSVEKLVQSIVPIASVA
jgi:hypothetical protein